MKTQTHLRHDLVATVIRADGTVDEIGVVASSEWSRFGPSRARAWWRTLRVNVRRGHWQSVRLNLGLRR